MFKVGWKSLLGRKLRLLMSTFAIVLGVAIVAGSLIFTDTVSRSFDAIYASSAAVSPVTASKSSGRVAATSSRSCSWLTPSAAVTQASL